MRDIVLDACAAARRVLRPRAGGDLPAAGGAFLAMSGVYRPALGLDEARNACADLVADLGHRDIPAAQPLPNDPRADHGRQKKGRTGCAGNRSRERLASARSR